MNIETSRYLSILGLKSAHSIEDVRIAYIAKIKQNHPDKFASDEKLFVQANEATAYINEAFSYLKGIYSHTIEKDYPTVIDIEIKNNNYIVQVSSSNIKSLIYNSKLNILAIIFHDLSSYQYFDVPEIVFEAFLKSPSKGQFANQNIYNKYPSKRTIN